MLARLKNEPIVRNLTVAAILMAFALVSAADAVLKSSPQIPLDELPRNRRRQAMRELRLRASHARPSLAYRSTRWTYVVERKIRYAVPDYAGRVVAVVMFALRPDGYRSFKDAHIRAYARLLGYEQVAWLGGNQELRERSVGVTQAAFAGIGVPTAPQILPSKLLGILFAKTRVSTISPLFYSKTPGGLPVIQSMTPFIGNVFFVDSGDSDNGDTTGHGSNPDTPTATIDYTIGLCTASQGDTIFACPGHNEGLASGVTIDLDVAGISVVGLGHGADRPRIDYDHATGSIDLGANSVVLRNFALLPSVTDVAIGIDVEAAVTNVLIEDVEALSGEDGGGVDEFALFIDVKAGCTRTHVKGLLYAQDASAAGTLSAVKLTGASDLVHIEDFWIEIVGAGVVAGINGATTLSTRCLIENGYVATDAEPGIELLTGTTGMIKNVWIFSNLATINAAIVADGCAFFECYYVEVGNESGVRIGTQSADD